jgi:Ca-activated chloride channel family protein
VNRRSAIRFLGIAGAVSFLRRVASQAAEPDLVIRSDVRLVLLDVSVKDRDGKLVAGLSSNSFSVLENGIPQKITVFASDDLPVTVGILVDASRSMAPKRKEVIYAAEAFIGSSNPRDEVFVLNFNDNVMRGLPEGVLFSSDTEQLRAALDRGVARGKTALNDAVVEGLQQLEHGKRDKKSLIVISDGGDNGSRHTSGEMFDRVERSIATVYTVGLLEPNNAEQDPGVLKRLAKISGGESYFPASLDGMPAVCQEIAADIRTRYTVGYAPASINGFGSLRQIRVKVTAPDRGKLTARTRTSYRYEDPTNPG